MDSTGGCDQSWKLADSPEHNLRNRAVPDRMVLLDDLQSANLNVAIAPGRGTKCRATGRRGDTVLNRVTHYQGRARG